MKKYTDFVAQIMLQSGHFKRYHFKPFPKEKVAKVHVYSYHGHKYQLNTAWAMDAPGFYPWVKFKWWNPIAFARYILLFSYTRVGVLKFKEPDESMDGKLVAPDHISMSSSQLPEGKASPRVVMTQLESKIWENHEKHRKIGSGLSHRAMLYIVIIIVVIFVALLMTGTIKIQGV